MAPLPENDQVPIVQEPVWTPQPVAHTATPAENDQVPIVQEPVWAPQPVAQFVEAPHNNPEGLGLDS